MLFFKNCECNIHLLNRTIVAFLNRFLALNHPQSVDVPEEKQKDINTIKNNNKGDKKWKETECIYSFLNDHKPYNFL